MEMIIIDKNNIEMIAKIEAMGTWEKEDNNFDIWTWNGKFYKIYKK
jgi:hypothetical protein